MDNIGSHLVEEGSVVRNNEQCTGIRLEVIGQESDGRDIQHIRRF